MSHAIQSKQLFYSISLKLNILWVLMRRNLWKILFLIISKLMLKKVILKWSKKYCIISICMIKFRSCCIVLSRKNQSTFSLILPRLSTIFLIKLIPLSSMISYSHNICTSWIGEKLLKNRLTAVTEKYWKS